MATGLSGIEPRQTTAHAPPIITGSDDSGASFFLTVDDGGPSSETDTETAESSYHIYQQPVQTPDRRSALLHPDSAGSLRPPSPQHSFPGMASEDGPADAGAAVAALKNPFNFQTQVISTSPVKPVCFPYPFIP
jgi:hypothetical protein